MATRPLNPQQKRRRRLAAQALALRGEGLTHYEIGLRLGVSASAVGRYLEFPEGANRPIDAYIRSWTRPEILEAFVAWEAENGSMPREVDWQTSSDPRWPSNRTVMSHFVRWSYAIEAARSGDG